jgi:hypothetical protein
MNSKVFVVSKAAMCMLSLFLIVRPKLSQLRFKTHSASMEKTYKYVTFREFAILQPGAQHNEIQAMWNKMLVSPEV